MAHEHTCPDCKTVWTCNEAEPCKVSPRCFGFRVQHRQSRTRRSQRLSSRQKGSEEGGPGLVPGLV